MRNPGDTTQAVTKLKTALLQNDIDAVLTNIELAEGYLAEFDDGYSLLGYCLHHQVQPEIVAHILRRFPQLAEYDGSLYHSPLELALMTGKVAYLKLLLDYPATLATVSPNRISPLIFYLENCDPTQHDHRFIIAKLIANFSIHQQFNRLGKGPVDALYVAVEREDTLAVHALLNAGAKANRLQTFGAESALECAQRLGNKKVIFAFTYFAEKLLSGTRTRLPGLFASNLNPALALQSSTPGPERFTQSNPEQYNPYKGFGK